MNELKELPKCPVCACSLFDDADDDPLVTCSRCRTPHHKDCWEYNGGCALYGCREQAPPDVVEIECWPSVLQDYHEWLSIIDHKRLRGVGFTLSCLMAVTFGVFATDLGMGAIFPLLSLIPMYLTGRSFVDLDRKAAGLQEDLIPITGEEPFAALVTTKETVRWMASVKSTVGNIHTGPFLDMLRALIIMLLIQFPVIFFLPVFKAAFLLAVDMGVLFLIKDSFVSMRKDQSILLQRFKLTFSPEGEETKKKAIAAMEDSSDCI